MVIIIRQVNFVKLPGALYKGLLQLFTVFNMYKYVNIESRKNKTKIKRVTLYQLIPELEVDHVVKSTQDLKIHENFQ